MNLPTDNLVVVLHRPQRLSNIGAAVRAMKNMGLRRLRLVEPAEFDAADITGIAHRSEDILEGLALMPDLDSALSDLTYIVGTSARPRGQIRPTTPRAIAPELLARATDGPVGLLFGPEDNGLSSSELDRCHRLVCIPTDPAYPSLNLAQAVLLLAYEIHLAAPAVTLTQRDTTPAPARRLEELFSVMERALWAVEFFKTEHTRSVMRTLRNLAHRADPDTREVALLTAICRETLYTLERRTRQTGRSE